MLEICLIYKLIDRWRTYSCLHIVLCLILISDLRVLATLWVDEMGLAAKVDAIVALKSLGNWHQQRIYILFMYVCTGTKVSFKDFFLLFQCQRTGALLHCHSLPIELPSSSKYLKLFLHLFFSLFTQQNQAIQIDIMRFSIYIFIHLHPGSRNWILHGLELQLWVWLNYELVTLLMRINNND